MIEVQANARGYFGGVIREEDERFFISDEKQLGSWMTPLNMPEAPAKPQSRSRNKAETVPQSEALPPSETQAPVEGEV